MIMAMWTNFYYGVVALALVFQVILLFTIFLGKWMGWRVLTRKIITVSLLAFVLINKFQLHINFYQQFYNLFTQW